MVLLLQSFLSALAAKKGIERNLFVKRGVKEILYSKEIIKIALFYSENSKNSQSSGDEKDPALQ
jgi:hypothetical protein